MEPVGWPTVVMRWQTNLAEIKPRMRGICVDFTLIPLYTNFPATCGGNPCWKTCMLPQISLAWRNVKNNRRTIGLLSLDNWRGINLWRNKNELSTLGGNQALSRI